MQAQGIRLKTTISYLLSRESLAPLDEGDATAKLEGFPICEILMHTAPSLVRRQQIIAIEIIKPGDWT